jgi:hypothetical protein
MKCERIKGEMMNREAANRVTTNGRSGKTGAKPLLLLLAVTISILIASAAEARIELVTLPSRDHIQLTIYNGRDITLVREKRFLTFRKGLNKIEFSWANTLIDPTSVEFRVVEQATEIDVIDTIYPANVKDVLVWNIESRYAGPALCEIMYFTSGLAWNADYMVSMEESGKKGGVSCFVKVDNKSGEDYANAETRLVVGVVHLVEDIATLAGKDEFLEAVGQAEAEEDQEYAKKGEAMDSLTSSRADTGASKPKEIVKEGLSEYFLYTVEGTEDILDQNSKRMKSFEAENVTLEPLVKYDTDLYGENPVRFLRVRNTVEDGLGNEPLPNGRMLVFQKTNGGANLRYLGADSAKYIPLGETCEINLGEVREMKLEKKLMNYRSENFLIDNSGEVNGWDDVYDYTYKINNFSDKGYRFSLKVHAEGTWDYKSKEAFAKESANTLAMEFDMASASEKKIELEIRQYNGERENSR